MNDLVFDHPIYLFAILPWLVLFIPIFFIQKKAILWIESNISKRFQHQFTKYNLVQMPIHLFMLCLIGILIIIASAGPTVPGTIEVNQTRGSIVFVIDASMSMVASDTAVHPITKKKPYDRLAQAQEVAMDLIDLFPDYNFGLITFSGDSVIHSPPTASSIIMKTIVQGLLTHSFDKTGTNFKATLQDIIHLSSKHSFQVVYISDGEVPNKQEKQSIQEELDTLKNLGIVVHSVGVGTKKGGLIRFFISYSEKEKKTDDENTKIADDSTGFKNKETHQRDIKKFTSYRSDEILEMMCQKTGGKYIVLEKGSWAKNLEKEIQAVKTKGDGKTKIQGSRDISYYFYLGALFLFLLDNLIIYKEINLKKT